MVFLNANDLDVDVLVDAFNPSTTVGRTALRARLSEPISDTKELTRRQSELRTIKNADKTKINELRALLKETEEDVISVGQASEDDRLKDYYTQILWDKKSMFAKLNHLGWLNEVIVFLRTIFVPGLSVMLPIFIFVAPLILMTYVLKEPVSFTKYIDMIQGAIKKAVPSVLGAPRFAGRGGMVELGEQFVHIGLAVAMLGASIWNQISSAIHMRSIVADMRKRAISVQTFTAATRELSDLLQVQVDLGPAWSFGALGVFGDAWNDPGRITTILDAAGHLDMLAAVALKKKTCFSTDSSGTVLTDVYYPGLPKPILNSVSLGGAEKAHVLLTGPNRGGKSTLLKSVGYAVLMSQTVGVVFARRAALPIFESIITALTPADVVGKMSLFEAEIEFAKTVMQQTRVGRTFLMMDEIFHGTNAHDGVEAAQVFLDQVYLTPTMSIVSTHYMELPKKYEAHTQNLCMGSTLDSSKDRLTYTYKLEKGINQHSSVREILRERGLLRTSSKKNIDGPK
jgi:predicted nucleotidyltransferase